MILLCHTVEFDGIIAFLAGIIRGLGGVITNFLRIKKLKKMAGSKHEFITIFVLQLYQANVGVRVQ